MATASPLVFFPTFWLVFHKKGDNTIHNLVLFSFKTNPIMQSKSPSLDFQHLALSRSSIFIISLLMQLMAHEYVLYVAFFASHVVLRHSEYDASKNVQIPTISEFDEIRRAG